MSDEKKPAPASPDHHTLARESLGDQAKRYYVVGEGWVPLSRLAELVALDTPPRDESPLRFTALRGPTGLLSLYLNDTRVAGEKPWGGGTVIAEWSVDPADIPAPTVSREVDEAAVRALARRWAGEFPARSDSDAYNAGFDACAAMKLRELQEVLTTEHPAASGPCGETITNTGLRCDRPRGHTGHCNFTRPAAPGKDQWGKPTSVHEHDYRDAIEDARHLLTHGGSLAGNAIATNMARALLTLHHFRYGAQRPRQVDEAASTNEAIIRAHELLTIKGVHPGIVGERNSIARLHERIEDHVQPSRRVQHEVDEAAVRASEREAIADWLERHGGEVFAETLRHMTRVPTERPAASGKDGAT